MILRPAATLVALIAVLGPVAAPVRSAGDTPASAKRTETAAAPGLTEDEMRELEVIALRISGNREAGIRSRTSASHDLERLRFLRGKFPEPTAFGRAQTFFLEASLWLEVFEDFERAMAIARQLQADFPNTPIAPSAQVLMEDAQRRLRLLETQRALVGKPAPALAFTWSSRKGLDSLAGLKGKVVVLYFWTSWTKQSVSGIPALNDVAAHYAGADVEIVGVTSLQGIIVGLRDEPVMFRDNPKGEMRAMTGYMKARRIVWPVVFTGESAFNPAYGIFRLPTIVVLSADGLVRYIGPAEETAKLTKMDLIDAALTAAGRKVPMR